MALHPFRTDSTVRFVCTDDPALQRDLAVDDAASRSVRLVPLERDTTLNGEPTIFELRALSWVEDQQLRGADSIDVIVETIKLGLVSIDGDVDKAQQFKADPRPRLVVAVYNAIHGLTWGND